MHLAYVFIDEMHETCDLRIVERVSPGSGFAKSAEGGTFRNRSDKLVRATERV